MSIQLGVIAKLPKRKVLTNLHKERFAWFDRRSARKRLFRARRDILRLAKKASCTPVHIIEEIDQARATGNKLSEVAEIIRLQTELQRKQAIDAMKVPIAVHPVTPTKEAVQYVKKLSTDMRDDHLTLSAIKKKMKQNRKKLFEVNDLPKGVVPELTYPMAKDLARRRAYGKQSLSKTYCVCPDLKHICVKVWKSGFADTTECGMLASALGQSGKTMWNKVKRHKRTDFSALQILPLDWDITENNEEEEKRINDNIKHLHDACLIFYDMDLEAVQRFRGGRAMNEHRRTLQMLASMSHIMPDKIWRELGAGMVEGVPNFFHGDIEYDEFSAASKEKNLPAARQRPGVVEKALTKEIKSQASITFSEIIREYTPHLGFILLGVVVKQHKKDRMIRHGSFFTEEIQNPINKCCVAKETEPQIRYGEAEKDHCQYIWSIAAHYPHVPIDLYDDDVSGAFQHQFHNPTVTKAN